MTQNTLDKPRRDRALKIDTNCHMVYCDCGKEWYDWKDFYHCKKECKYD